MNVVTFSISVCVENEVLLWQVALSSVRRDLLSQKGSLVSLYVKPRQCAKKNIYVIGGMYVHSKVTADFP
jgi:hypothetical protein